VTAPHVDALTAILAEHGEDYPNGCDCQGLLCFCRDVLDHADHHRAHVAQVLAAYVREQVAQAALPQDELSAAYHELGTHGVRKMQAAAWDEGHARHAPMLDKGETPCFCANPYRAEDAS